MENGLDGTIRQSLTKKQAEDAIPERTMNVAAWRALFLIGTLWICRWLERW